MPRQSGQPPAGSAKENTPKRPATDTPNRTSKRARVTTRRSYIEPDTDSDAASNASGSFDDEDAGDASDFEAKSDKEASSESEPDADASDEEPVSKKATARGRPQKKQLPTHKKQADEKDLWKRGAKLEPGTQLIIKKPKAREAGDTAYTESTIHPNTMLFLEELKENNDRQWLKLHDPDYRVAVQDFNDFVGKLTERIVEIDVTIPELPVKDIVYRIYRDVRFSKDQTPYKSYFSAAWSRTGRKGPYAAYYVQIQPNGGSFVGGGLWQPDAEPLRKLRREFDRRSSRIKQILADERIRKSFLGGAPDNEKKVVKAFVSAGSNASTALKRSPKDFPIDHQDIELLRLRSFTLGKKLSDEEVVGPKGMGRIAELLSYIEPFITYLNSVVMPDEESSSSSENDDDDEGEDEDDDEDGASAADDANE
ncbi:hypothetical protein C7974DRAFT_400746 [Boeremia exigua]|uniref:uncharacterized protein n=1 Tax=Boeremia exigua TaxID=749465 RepID=UPI001E8CBF9F|nr:uncharacterized protein C7974DRAFT_400746 [Boeremia exigua]KAH6618737.1 hypothetical protein C7974DRAFT_400746 [Boeremia exigua]